MSLLSCLRGKERRCRTSAILVVVVATIALLSSCAHPPAKTRGPRSTVHLSPLAWNLLMATPSTENDDQRLAAAVSLSIKRCMGQKGLLYFPTRIDEIPTPYRVSLPEYPTIYSLSSRKVNGYGLYENAVQVRRGKGKSALGSESQYISKLSPRRRSTYYLALQGDGAHSIKLILVDGIHVRDSIGGCQAFGARAIYGSIAGYVMAVTGVSMVRVAFYQHVRSSVRFRALTQSWARCMAKHGLTYANPMAAYEGLASEYDRGGPSNKLRFEEIKTAIIDFNCASEMHLIERTIALQEMESSHLPVALIRDMVTYSVFYASALRRLRGR